MPHMTRQKRYVEHGNMAMDDILKEINDENDSAVESENLQASPLQSVENVNEKSSQSVQQLNGFATPKRMSKRKSKLSTNGHVSESADEEEPGSPPKQQKSQSLIFSPSHLISSLCLETPRKDKEEKKSRIKDRLSKYGSARKVLNGAETDDLPGRESEIQELRNYLFDHLDTGKSGSMYVSGQPGTGKTACLTHILRSDEVKSKFTKVYINCTGIATLGSIYKKICTELNLKLETKTEKECLKAIERYLFGKHKMLLLLLDEVDQLAGKKQSILYTIFEWPAKPNSKVLLVAIANQLDLTDRTLTRLNAKCELKPKLMHFAPYTKEQLVDIFKSRLEAAGVLHVFSPGTIQLLSAKVAAVSGDVRRALDIGRRVVELAEQQQNKSKSQIDLSEFGINGSPTSKATKSTNDTSNDDGKSVNMQMVVNVLKNVYGASQNLNEDIEDTFPLQQKILICCLLLILNNDKNKDITIGRLHDVFKRVCAKRNLLAVDQGEFVGLCSLVETRGIIRVLSKKEPRLHKIVLQWDQDEVSSALKDKQLIAAILQDTSCLRR